MPNETIFDIENEEPKLFKSNNECPVYGKCIDIDIRKQSINEMGREFLKENEKIYNVCRYYSYIIDNGEKNVCK